MIYNIYKKYKRRVCIHVNNTLNSQLSYWNGQKKWLETAPSGEEFPCFRQFTLNGFKPFSILADWFRERNVHRMRWSVRPRNRVGWGICIRLNAPPNSGTTIRTRQKKFYKQQSLKVIKRGLKWIFQIGYTNCEWQVGQAKKNLACI